MNEKMKAAVLYAVGDIRYEQVKIPQVKEGEALVKVKVCGICASDIPRVMEKGTYHFPLIPGHEISGIVAQKRKGNSKIKEGDRVTIFPLLPCYKCSYCQRGRYNLCDNYDYLGSRSDGGFAEYVKAPVNNLVRIPPTISYEEAALVEPSAVALHAINRVKVEINDSIAILGVGFIGIVLAQWARIRGVRNIFLVDIKEEKLKVARQYSFEKIINAAKENPVEKILKESRGGVDISIEAAGVPTTFKQYLQLTKKGGKVILLGNMRGEVKLSENLISGILRKELTLYGSWNSVFTHFPKNEWETTLYFIKIGELKVKPLITHHFKLKQVKKVFWMMHEGREFFNKVIFVLD